MQKSAPSLFILSRRLFFFKRKRSTTLFFLFNSHQQLRHTLFDRGDEQQLKRVFLKSASSLATDLSLNIHWNTRGGIFERERERNDAIPNSGAHFWTLFCISPDKTSSFFGVWSTTLLIFFFSDSTCLLNNHHHHHYHHQSRVREESAGCFVVWLRSSSLFFFVFVVGIKVV